MNCWQVLGVEPDADKKTIKLAYAKRLKKTRPDDDPDGFKALHAAYKTALSVCAQPRYDDYYAGDDDFNHGYYAAEPNPVAQVDEAPAAPAAENDKAESTEQHALVEETLAPQTAAESAEQPLTAQDVAVVQDMQLEQAAPVETTDSVSAPVAAAPSADLPADAAVQGDAVAQTEADAEAMALYAELDRDWDYIDDTAQELIRSPQKLNDVKSWQFIERVPSMVDLEFRTQVSNHLFGIVAEANQISLEKRALYIKAPVLDYLNEYFQWDQNWSHLSMAHGDELMECVFPYLTPKKNRNTMFGSKVASDSPSELFYYGRIGAFALDLLVPIPFVLLVNSFDFDPDIYIRVAGIYLLLVLPLMEASRLQASAGKRLLKLIVVNKQGLRIPWYQSFWRSWVSVACLLGFKVVVWINMYMSWRHNMLLQDYLSRSYVTELRD